LANHQISLDSFTYPNPGQLSFAQWEYFLGIDEMAKRRKKLNLVDKQTGEFVFSTQRHRLLKIAVGFRRKSADNVGGNGDAGNLLPQDIDNLDPRFKKTFFYSVRQNKLQFLTEAKHFLWGG
jgi:hypothetical protein